MSLIADRIAAAELDRAGRRASADIVESRT
jgi:hypothetical protein